MKIGLRGRLLLACVTPCVLLVILAVVSVPQWVLVAATASITLAVGIAIYTLTMPFERLRQGAQELLHQTGMQDGPPIPGDGAKEVSHAIGVLLDRLDTVKKESKNRDAQFDDTLRTLTNILVLNANDWRTTPKAAPITSPWPERTTQFTAAYTKFHEATNTLGQRATVFQSLLHNLPLPVLVFDTNNELQMMNLAAEKIYTQFVDRTKRYRLADFFMVPVVKSTHHDATVPMTPDEVVNWVATSNGGDRDAVAAVPGGRGLRVNVTIASKLVRKSQKYVTLVLRDISVTQKAEWETRLSQRRVLGQRLCLLMDNQSKPALNVIRTQAGLLAQAAKQAGQRDRFVPKVQRLLEELGRQDIIVDQLGWLGRLTQSFGVDQDHTELRIKDVITAAVERLTPSYSDRNNTTEIQGEAGWIMADEDWMQALFVGLLMHANLCAEQANIVIALARRSVQNSQDESVEINIRYTGTSFNDELLQDIREPFRRPDSQVFDPSAPIGFPLGLAVAQRIVTIKNGGLDFESAGKNQTIRIQLPTRDRRLKSTPAPVSTVNAAEPAEMEVDTSDTLSNWSVGGVKSATQTLPEAPTANPDNLDLGHEPTLIDDSVGAWFGGN